MADKRSLRRKYVSLPPSACPPSPSPAAPAPSQPRAAPRPYLAQLHGVIYAAAAADPAAEFLLAHDPAAAPGTPAHHRRAFALRPADACPRFRRPARTQAPPAALPPPPPADRSFTPPHPPLLSV